MFITFLFPASSSAGSWPQRNHHPNQTLFCFAAQCVDADLLLGVASDIVSPGGFSIRERVAGTLDCRPCRNAASIGVKRVEPHVSKDVLRGWVMRVGASCRLSGQPSKCSSRARATAA